MESLADLPRVHKVANGELLGQGGRKALSVLDQIVVQEPRVGVQQFHLLNCCLGHMWMAVSNYREPRTGKALVSGSNKQKLKRCTNSSNQDPQQ